MGDLERKSLRNSYEFVVNRLDNVRPILDRLISCDALSPEEVELIRIGDTKAERARRLLDKVICSDKSGLYQNFIDALKTSNYDSIVNEIGAKLLGKRRNIFKNKSFDRIDDSDSEIYDLHPRNQNESRSKPSSENGNISNPDPSNVTLTEKVKTNFNGGAYQFKENDCPIQPKTCIELSINFTHGGKTDKTHDSKSPTPNVCTSLNGRGMNMPLNVLPDNEQVGDGCTNQLTMKTNPPSESSDLGSEIHIGRLPEEMSFNRGQGSPADPQELSDVSNGSVHVSSPIRGHSSKTVSKQKDTRTRKLSSRRQPLPGYFFGDRNNQPEEMSGTSTRSVSEENPIPGSTTEPTQCTRFVILSGERGPNFGFELQARKTAKNSTFFVSQVMPGGSAEKEGKMASGDLINSINGHSCSTMNHADAIHLILNSGPQLALQVTSLGRIRTSRFPVSLTRRSKEGWGLKFVSGRQRPRFPNDCKYYINCLVEGSVSAQSESLKIGDTLISCNGVKFEGNPIADIEKDMKSTPFITLQIERTEFERACFEQIVGNLEINLK